MATLSSACSYNLGIATGVERAQDAAWLAMSDTVSLASFDADSDYAIGDKDFARAPASPPAVFDDLVMDFMLVSVTMDSTVQQHAYTDSLVRRSSVASPSRRPRTNSQSPSPSSQRSTKAKIPGGKSGRPRGSRKKDDAALDHIYAELQESVGLCRYWGKRCWNLRAPKLTGDHHSLCHFHRTKANNNQRRFDYKRRGTMWRPYAPDPSAEDVSLFPDTPDEVAVDLSSARSFDTRKAKTGARYTSVKVQLQVETALKFEPFARPVALREQDVELLHEVMRSSTELEEIMVF